LETKLGIFLTERKSQNSRKQRLKNYSPKNSKILGKKYEMAATVCIEQKIFKFLRKTWE
jgi:hypothetical protein